MLETKTESRATDVDTESYSESDIDLETLEEDRLLTVEDEPPVEVDEGDLFP